MNTGPSVHGEKSLYDKRQIITSCNLTLLEFGSTACICYAGGI